MRSAAYDKNDGQYDSRRRRSGVESDDVRYQGELKGGEEWEGIGADSEVDGKVGMAVIFNKVPADGGVVSWDYTLRFNYSYGVSQLQEQVGFLVG